MNVIFHTADDKRLAVVVREDATEVTVQFVAQGLVTKKRTAFFG
jgi:hypothetical protein